MQKAAKVVDMPLSQYIRMVMNNISAGIVLSDSEGGLVILERSLRNAIELKAYKLGELQGEAFEDIDGVVNDDTTG